MDRNKIKRLINQIMDDKEIWAGGIFQKEAFYMKKYNLNQLQMDLASIFVYNAVKALENAERAEKIDERYFPKN